MLTTYALMCLSSAIPGAEAMDANPVFGVTSLIVTSGAILGTRISVAVFNKVPEVVDAAMDIAVEVTDEVSWWSRKVTKCVGLGVLFIVAALMVQLGCVILFPPRIPGLSLIHI